MPVPVRGRGTYYMVHERLTEAHGEQLRPVGIMSIKTTFESLGDWFICRAAVTFADGRVFNGSAEVTRGDGGSAQGTNPVEVAETSAVGRALAMAGWFGSGEGIAGYEEVAMAAQRAPLPSTVGRARRVEGERL